MIALLRRVKELLGIPLYWKTATDVRELVDPAYADAVEADLRARLRLTASGYVPPTPRSVNRAVCEILETHIPVDGRCRRCGVTVGAVRPPTVEQIVVGRDDHSAFREPTPAERCAMTDHLLSWSTDGSCLRCGEKVR